jgi:hypothetical protein
MPCRLEEQGESGSDKARCRPCSAKLEKAVRQVNFANLQSQALWVLSARAQALFVAYLETILGNAQRSGLCSLSTEGLLAVVVLRVGGRHNNEANFNWRSPEQKAQVSQKMHQILTYLVNAEDVDGT